VNSPLASMEVVAALLEAGSVEGTFAGGTVLPLLVEPIVKAQLRPTLDVDVIVRAQDYFEYQEQCQVLLDAGFSPGQEAQDPLCRYRRKGLVVDIMPTPYRAMGTDNPWFSYGVETAVEHRLPSGRRVRTVAPVRFGRFHGHSGNESRPVQAPQAPAAHQAAQRGWSGIPEGACRARCGGRQRLPPPERGHRSAGRTCPAG